MVSALEELTVCLGRSEGREQGENRETDPSHFSLSHVLSKKTQIKLQEYWWKFYYKLYGKTEEGIILQTTQKKYMKVPLKSVSLSFAITPYPLPWHLPQLSTLLSDRTPPSLWSPPFSLPTQFSLFFCPCPYLLLLNNLTLWPFALHFHPHLNEMCPFGIWRGRVRL